MIDEIHKSFAELYDKAYKNGYKDAKKKFDRPHGKWEYLKEHITEMRDADGELNQKDTCQFILNLMGVIEKEGETSDKTSDNR